MEAASCKQQLKICTLYKVKITKMIKLLIFNNIFKNKFRCNLCKNLKQEKINECI